MSVKLELDKLYIVEIDGAERIVRTVDGEAQFHEPGISHGFVHFASPRTGEKIGFCGIAWFESNAIRLYGN